jgi:hypothetical protein
MGGIRCVFVEWCSLAFCSSRKPEPACSNVGMGETIIFLNSSNNISSRHITATNNGYKITVCSTTWYDTCSIDVPSVPLLQEGDTILFMFQTQSNCSLQMRKSTDMAQFLNTFGKVAQWNSGTVRNELEWRTSNLRKVRATALQALICYFVTGSF